MSFLVWLLQASPFVPLLLVLLYLLSSIPRLVLSKIRRSTTGEGFVHLEDTGDGKGGKPRPLFALFINEEDILEVEGSLHRSFDDSQVGGNGEDEEEETMTREQLESLLPPSPRLLIYLPLVELMGWTGVVVYQVLRSRKAQDGFAVELATSGATALAWLSALAYEFSHRSRLPPWPLLIQFLSLFTNASIDSIQQYHNLTRNKSISAIPLSLIFDLVNFGICARLILVIIQMPLRAPLASVLRDQARGDQRARPQSPEDDNTLLGSMTYSWMNPIMALARTRKLLPSDVWALALANRAEVLARRFNSLTDKTLTRRILRASARDIAIDVTLKLVAVSMLYLRPYFIQKLLEKLSEDENDRNSSFYGSTRWTARDQAYLYGLFAFLAMSFRTIAQQSHFHHARQIGMRLRSELTVAVYEKALRRKDVAGRAHAVSSNDEKEQADESASRGKVVSLISDDTNKVLRMGCDSHLIYGAPLEIVWGLALLYNLLGWSAFVGFALLLACLPFHYWLGKRASRLSLARSVARDRRQASFQELISAIRTIKFFGWSQAWSEKVGDKRAKELRSIVREWVNNELFNLLWVLNTALVPIVSLATYVKIQQMPVTVAILFTGIALFVMVRDAAMQIPGFGIKIIQCRVSIARIEAFLNEEEVEKHATPEQRATAGSRLALENATLQYSSDALFQLRNLSIEFPKGQLTVISGPTGSGKTSVLLALLGELQLLDGSVSLPPRVAFAAQSPWLESSTIRDTITFGSPFDQERYDTTLYACALVQDLKSFPEGDTTHIGERGVSLSGGQKARLALARAIYSFTDVVLLDDVLSAVDAGTGRHLFEHVLTGPLLKDRTTVLVTHHVNMVLPGASYHVMMDRGQIASQRSVETVSAGPSRTASVIESSSTRAEDEFSGSKVDNLEPVSTAPADETWSSGALATSIFTTYLKHASYLLWAVILLFTLAIPLAGYTEQFWLRTWAEASPQDQARGENRYLLGYLGLNLISVTSIMGRNIVSCFASLRASRTIFTILLRRVVRAQPRWYDITPVGRILNRFTNDLGVLDSELTLSFCTFGGMIITLLISFAVNFFILPVGVIPIVTIGAVYFVIFLRYLSVSRDINRIAATTASPLFSGFQQALVGISTIRAFGRERDYRRRVCQILDDTLSLWYATATLDVWMQYRTQLLASATLLFTSILAVYSEMSPGLAGIAINASQAIILTLDGLCNTYARLVLSLNSWERVTEYLELPQEPQDGDPAPASWPSATTKSSLVDVQDLVIKYAPELPPILHGVTFSIKPGERCAIVGRTGAGKSTLAMSLLRVVDPSEGSIVIDGLDITKIALDDLRSRITLLPQDAVLFSGSLRHNLDPFDEHTDEECMDALRRVHILAPSAVPVRGETHIEAFASSNAKSSTTLSLRTLVAEGGDNWSQGQKQLISMARALLRNPVILILDESTASLDADLDSKLQATIREQFQQTAVLTIAHRLRTIMDNSRVIVMDAGRIVEYDSPKALLQNEQSFFAQMCRQSGEFEELREIAMNS